MPSERPAKRQKTEVPCAFMLSEKFNVSMLQSCSYLKSLDEQNEAAIKNILKITSNQINMPVQYRPTADNLTGRVYPDGAASIGSLKGSIRRLVGHEDFHDIDMVNCLPSIAHQLFVKEGFPACPVLDRYVQDRQGFIDELRDTYHEHIGHLSSTDFKKELLKCLFHGNFPNNNIMNNVPPLAQLKQHFIDYGQHPNTLSKYHDMFDAAHPNPYGSFISKIFQSHEVVILKHMIEFFRTQCKDTFYPRVAMHDGVMVGRTSQHEHVPEDVLRSCEQYIHQQTQFRMRLVEKSLQPTSSDWEFLYGPKALHKYKSINDRCLAAVYQHGYTKKFIRFAGNVLKPHPEVVGVYVKHVSYEEFINEALDVLPDKAIVTKFEPILTNMETVDHVTFPLYTDKRFNQNIVAFKNGFVYKDTMKFVKKEKNKCLSLTTTSM